MASVKKIQGKKGVAYKITVTIGRTADGKQKRHYMTYRPPEGAKERDIKRELQKIVAEYENALFIESYQPDSKITFSEYAEYVYNLKERNGAKPSTLETFDLWVRRLKPYIGNMRLIDIRPRDINSVIDILRKDCKKYAYPKETTSRLALQIPLVKVFKDTGIANVTWRKVRQGQRVSLKTAEKVESYLQQSELFEYRNDREEMASITIRGLVSILNIIFDRAYKEMIIQYNPAERVILPPSKPKKEKRALQPEELKNVLSALQSETTQFQTLVTLLICTGCRRGEALGLTWGKVDLEKAEITIDQALLYTPKTGNYISTTKTGNTRKVAIPQELVNLLRKHRAEQAQERLLIGDLWENNDLIFTTSTGKAIAPDRLNCQLTSFCKRHSLPHINPHMFRHTAASLLIANGVDVVTVATSLGHKNIMTTLNIYSHEIESAKRKTADTMSAALFQKKA